MTMRTIWGTTQHQQKLATGVYIVDTASHGGIIVRQDVADKYISEKVRKIVNRTLSYGWYHFEEDCDWAAFAYENQSIMPKRLIEFIRPSLERWYPELLR